MENLEKQFHQLTHNAMLSVNRQFDDAVIWEWIITNFEPKDSNKVDAVVSGKFAELADKLFKQYSRFNELPLMTKDEFSLCIKHLLEHIFESKFSR